MTKLRNLFAVALVMLPAVTLNASSLSNAEARPGFGTSQPVAGMCWFNIGGRWYYLPCS